MIKSRFYLSILYLHTKGILKIPPRVALTEINDMEKLKLLISIFYFSLSAFQLNFAMMSTLIFQRQACIKECEKMLLSKLAQNKK